jgi:BirA family biotin operon repressor/biotin-[acetyl-CoA-carboxylase] ligase
MTSPAVIDLTFLGVPVRHVERCASTMEIVARLAASGAPEGTSILADEQSAGRGRAGRAWTAPAGTSILLSALLRPNIPPERLGQLSILLAVCVARVVERWTGRSAAIKWPNDVLVDGMKVSGVLARVRFPDGGTPEIVIGIGLNVTTPPAALPTGAASLLCLTGHEYDRIAVLRDLLTGLETMYGAFRQGDVTALWREATDRLAYVGEEVRIVEDGRDLIGTLLGLSPAGALRLRLRDGSAREIWSGDLVRGPRPLAK